MTAITGLTTTKAKEILATHGPNSLGEEKKLSWLTLLLVQFKSPLIYILAFAGLITLFLQEWTDAIVILAAVFINTFLGFYQEQKAQKALSALRSFLHPQTRVIRDNEQKLIPVEEVVPGDLVVLTIGDRVPADGILLEATDLSVNEAILTGESLPVKKRKSKSEKDKSEESRVFMGTMIAVGIGKMRVQETGQQSKMGKIGQTVAEAEEEKTPLQVQLGKLAQVLAIVVGVITLLIFLLGRFTGHSVLEMFTLSVAVAVAAIPEGLVVTLTVILTLGMQRILKRKALVRRLVATETLGAVDLICADKTGTLTEGKLTVVKAETDDEELLIKTAILCNDQRDPLEVAMKEWAEKKLKSNPASWRGKQARAESIKSDYPRLDEIPFSPKTKLIVTLHPSLLIVSGAPEVVLQHSKLKNKKAWLGKFDQYGQKGFRLVGFAVKKVARDKKQINHQDLENLDWLGILIYEDPVREGVREVLQLAQKAGIEVKVITGDYLPTALAVLKKLGLDGEQKAITGDQLAKIKTEQLKERISQIILFARIDPEQKLKIVQVFKESNRVVAMMGDGVNDAPALKQADIGIVVNDSSDVAKETADMVLLDSEFATIVAAIKEGRTIFENIKKVVLYLLSDSFTEIILIGSSLVLGLPLPVTAVQILWVNLVEDTLPGIALAFEPEEKELMADPPRYRNSPILDAELKLLIFVIGIVLDFCLLGVFYWLMKIGLDFAYVQTMMFVALGIDSLFIALACRSLRKTVFHYNPLANLFLSFSLLLGLLMLVAAVHWPPLQRLLGTVALNGWEWLFLILLGLFSLAVIEVTKWIFISRHRS